MSHFYRHYKNKDYKYIGVAKHSETLEELVVYQCLYDNPEGHLWVRPRAIFESVVNVGGQEQQRFAPVSFEIQAVSVLDEKQRYELGVLIKDIFPLFSIAKIDQRLQLQNVQLLLAYFERELVGFKMGYERTPGQFYSWLGGVNVKWRGRGVGSSLMSAQHAWCRSEKYAEVFTKTKNSFREMLMLNLSFGFHVIGLEESDGEPKILLKKSIASG